ncbi:MAG: ACT domain-containing protein [Acidobacteriota bacterium]
MPDPRLTVLGLQLSIHRLEPADPVPPAVLGSGFYSVTRTAEELSIVCDSGILFASPRTEAGWACLKVEGPLDFGLTGVLAGISGALASSGVSIVAISTFDTDYILVKSARLPDALRALECAGYDISPARGG